MHSRCSAAAGCVRSATWRSRGAAGLRCRCLSVGRSLLVAGCSPRSQRRRALRLRTAWLRRRPAASLMSCATSTTREATNTSWMKTASSSGAMSHARWPPLPPQTSALPGLMNRKPMPTTILMAMPMTATVRMCQRIPHLGTPQTLSQQASFPTTTHLVLLLTVPPRACGACSKPLFQEALLYNPSLEPHQRRNNQALLPLAISVIH